MGGGHCDLHVKKCVPVGVNEVVTEALGVVGQHVDAPGVEDLVQLGDMLLGLGPGDLRLDDGGVGLARVVARGQPGGGGGGGAAAALKEGLPGVRRGGEAPRRGG